MSPVAKEYVAIEDFPGLSTNVDGSGEQVPPGTSERQINFMGRRPGLLETRPGLITVVFEAE